MTFVDYSSDSGNILKQAYEDDAEFNVIKVILTDTMNITEFKFVIEPITFNKLDEKEVENTFKFIESVFGYSRGNNKISIALIKSNNWVKDMDIILDQDLPVYEALVDDEGFTKYIPDIYGYYFITKVNELKNYIEEFTKILVKTDPITIPILNAMTMYFDDFAVSDYDIQETDEYLKYICNVDYTNPCTIARFTIDKNSGIIVDIEVKYQ